MAMKKFSKGPSGHAMPSAGRESEGDEDTFKLTETELAELNKIKLATGLSESELNIVRKVTKRISYPLRHKGKGPPPPVHRDAMGKYKPREGEKPLSELDRHPAPCALDYSPKVEVTLKSAPVYTLGENHFTKSKRGTPGPKYNLQGNLNWTGHKKITVKGKFTQSQKVTSPGPKYDTRSAVKGGITMSSREKSGKLHGFVPAIYKEPDPSLPGPKYDPFPEPGKPVTFGYKPQRKRDKHPPPGPNKYNIRGQSEGPKCSLGEKLDAAKGDHSGPGPAAHTVPPLVPSKGGPAPVIIGNRRPPKIKSWTPGPDEYHRAGFDLSEPGFTMKYKTFEPDPKLVPKRPGPAAYTPKLPGQKNPGFSFARKTKLTYPSDVYSQLTVVTPGPAQYNTRTKQKIPQGTFGAARKSKPDKNPGPADYGKDPLVVLPRAPAYSLGTSRPKPTKKGYRTPAPNAYAMKDPPTKRATMARKFQRPFPSCHYSPGPAAYTPCSLKTCHDCEPDGATMKSRHTPLQFSGLKTMGTLQPNTMPNFPLIA